MDTKENERPSLLKVLVGTYTSKDSQGIYCFDFDSLTGELTNRKLVAETSNPSYFSFSADRRFVYAVNENRDDGTICSYEWNEEKKDLKKRSQHSSEGGLPCHTELNRTGDRLAVSNYWTGDFAVFKLGEEGEILGSPCYIKHEGSGPVRPNQATARGHCARFSPNDRFLYAVDLGIDQIVTYPMSESGPIGLASARLNLDPGDGPRHLTFHPSRALAFVVNELSGSVLSLKVDHEKGVLERIDKKSTYPDDYVGKLACADIRISDNGKFLYVSNRVHDSIAIFSVSEEGELTRLAIESVRGSWPRNFTFSPDGKFLIAANQKSDSLTVFSVDQETGLLTFTGCEVPISIPVVVKF